MSDTVVPPKVNPLGKPGTLKLKPVLRTPGAAAKPAMPVKPAAPAAAAPAADPAPAAEAAKPQAMEQLKAVTQSLKSITSPIPQQAILRKTGIIGDKEMTEAQRQAAMARTSRISLNEAIGASAVKDEAAPMKTIRIKRPVAIQRPGAAAKPAAPAADGGEAESSVTQKKTLKIQRPGGVRPTAKFGIKKPAAPAAEPAEGGEVAELAPVDDIPELPTAAAAPAAKVVRDVPKGVAIAGIIFQLAACAVIGFLTYMLFQDTQLPLFCGGCMP